MSLVKIISDVLQKKIDDARERLKNFENCDKESLRFKVTVSEYTEEDIDVTSEHRGTLRDAMLVALSNFRKEYKGQNDLDFYVVVILDTGEEINLSNVLWLREDWYKRLISSPR